MPGLLHPRSRGSVRLNASDPHGQPLVTFGYFTDEADHDLAVMVEGLKMGLAQEERLAKLGLTLDRDPQLVPECR